jgi:hypothetical protein
VSASDAKPGTIAGRKTGDPMHMSPFEHIAVALDDAREKSGNFDGWGQYRKEIPGENYTKKLYVQS